MTYVQDFYAKKGICDNMFSLSRVGVNDVRKVIGELGAGKATGLDTIPVKFIKDGCNEIAKPLTHIINMSISSGDIPADLKIARVVPLHKKNSRTDVGNYRPVSVLSVVSKVIEKLVFKQLNSYLNDQNLLYELQSGFRPSYSTDTSLIHLFDHIKKENDNGNYTGMVLLDLQKAFDTVDHSVLLQKLKALGLDKSAVGWFHSYLTNREQVSCNEGVHSEKKLITCGVPQGSILGPLLFLIYVNDMALAVNCKLMLYADDSALLVSGKEVVEIEEKLKSELESVSEWLCENKLSLHLGKTESILFGTKHNLKHRPWA